MKKHGTRSVNARTTIFNKFGRSLKIHIICVNPTSAIRPIAVSLHEKAKPSVIPHSRVRANEVLRRKSVNDRMLRQLKK